MNFAELDWRILDRLRATFLGESFGRAAYWQSARDLEQYDQTFGERIGWKWDAVLAELSDLGWTPPATVTHVIDWACGAGVAGRRALRAFTGLRRIEVFDASPLAMDFALRRVREECPEATAAPMAGRDATGSLLLISHVWNELETRQRVDLLKFASAAAAIIWVEPGTHEIARDLQTVRDHFRSGFDVIAPCTHQGACGLLATGMDRHWCHHFARPPAEVFVSGDWARFAERAGIDLRALPYSFLAFQRRPEGAAPRPDDGWERLIGRARMAKPCARILSCGASGVCDTEVTKRDLPDLFRLLKNDEAPQRVRWTRNGSRAQRAEAG